MIEDTIIDFVCVGCLAIPSFHPAAAKINEVNPSHTMFQRINLVPLFTSPHSMENGEVSMWGWICGFDFSCLMR